MSGTLDTADAELKHWRDRLAAASRNVCELSELPEVAAARALAGSTGRLAEQARLLAATLDELWQGVLLIGATLDRAEAVRRQTSLFRSDKPGRDALAILRGASITVDLAETPVLHRKLLAGPRATATVSPEELLQTMEAAFDHAREQLAGITEAGAQADSLRARLAAAIAGLPAPAAFAARLDATDGADPLDRLDALTALAHEVTPARAAADRARAALAAAAAALAGLQALAGQATAAAEASREAVAQELPVPDAAALPMLAAWLDRVGRTFESGRLDAAMVGLANWHAQHDRIAADLATLRAAAVAALAERDDLRGRLGALRAKHRARPAADQTDPTLEALAAAATAALDLAPVDLAVARRELARYAASLASGGRA